MSAFNNSVCFCELFILSNTGSFWELLKQIFGQNYIGWSMNTAVIGVIVLRKRSFLNSVDKQSQGHAFYVLYRYMEKQDWLSGSSCLFAVNEISLLTSKS